MRFFTVGCRVLGLAAGRMVRVRTNWPTASPKTLRRRAVVCGAGEYRVRSARMARYVEQSREAAEWGLQATYRRNGWSAYGIVPNLPSASDWSGHCVMRREQGTSLEARGIRKKAGDYLRRLVRFVADDTSGQLLGLLLIAILGALVWLYRVSVL